MLKKRIGKKRDVILLIRCFDDWERRRKNCANFLSTFDEKEKVKTKRKWVVDSVEMNNFHVEVDKIYDLLVLYDEERNHYEVYWKKKPTKHLSCWIEIQKKNLLEKCRWTRFDFFGCVFCSIHCCIIEWSIGSISCTIRFKRSQWTWFMRNVMTLKWWKENEIHLIRFLCSICSPL